MDENVISAARAREAEARQSLHDMGVDNADTTPGLCGHPLWLIVAIDIERSLRATQ